MANYHITQINDTRSNVSSDLDANQVAIFTDQNKEFCFKGSDGTLQVVATQYSYDGSVAYKNLTFGTLTADTSLFVGDDKPINLGNTNAAPDSFIEWDTSRTTDGLAIDTSSNVYVQLGDASGANKFVIEDSSGTEMAYITSDGLLHLESLIRLQNTSGIIFNYSGWSSSAGTLAWSSTLSPNGMDLWSAGEIYLRLADSTGAEKLRLLNGDGNTEVFSIDSLGNATTVGFYNAYDYDAGSASRGGIKTVTVTLSDEESIALATLMGTTTEMIGTLFVTYDSTTGSSSHNGSAIYVLHNSGSVGTGVVMANEQGLFDDADTDSCFCVYETATGTQTVKNRIGQEVNCVITFVGATSCSIG